MKKITKIKRGAVTQPRAKRAVRTKPAATPDGPDPRQALAVWGFPLSFPCRLVVLPTRIASYCAARGYDTIGGLLDEVDRLGFTGLRGQSQLGLASVRPLERLVNALRNMDSRTAADFLPLDDATNKPSLERAFALAVGGLPDPRRALLNCKLIERMSASASAEMVGSSRQWAFVVEADYLNKVREYLEYFAGERASLLNAWLKGEDWSKRVPLTKLENDRKFILATLEAVFWSTPQGIARASKEQAARDALLERCYNELVNHPDLWFGGVELLGFIRDRLPEAEHQGFYERVVRLQEVRFHIADGRVRPIHTGLRVTVKAMLARNKGPLPLSRLIELVAKTGHHKSVPPWAYQRLSKIWRRNHGFPSERILWDK